MTIAVADRDQVAAVGGSQARTPAVLVVAAMILTMSSTPGQTYFISLFAPHLKRELGLSDGGFGLFYTAATIGSAAVLMATGRVVDHYRIRGIAALNLVGLAILCVAMAHITAAWMLLPLLFALRLLGQGYPGHLAVTGAARWYARRRGRMISLAILGFPAAEATMPLSVVALGAIMDWREIWLVGAAVLILVSLPLVVWILRREPPHDLPPAGPADPGREAGRQWTRGEVLARPEFHAALFCSSAPAFVMTGVFFHQAHLATVKGWGLGWMAACFPIYAGTAVATAVLAGWLIDRIGSVKLLPWFLLPMSIGVVAPAVSDSPWAVPVMMALGALTTGSAAPLLGALWAEIFGTRHLGGIRSIVVAAQVLGSALAPGLIGLLLDAGIAIEAQFLGMVAYGLGCAVLMALLAPRLGRLSLLRH